MICIDYNFSCYCGNKNIQILGSGYGTVDKLVASDTREPRFESKQRQLL